MPRPFLVEADQADAVLAEVLFRLKRKQAQASESQQVYDPDLADTPEEYQARLQAMRGDGGLKAYAEYVYGYDTSAPHHSMIIETLQALVFRRLQHPTTGKRIRKVLILAPPNTAKSTYVSQVFPPWFTSIFQSDPVLFFTSSDPNAGLFDSAYSLAFTESERHKLVFPNATPAKYKGWSSDKRFLKGMRLGSKDPNFKAVGFGAKILGARAEGIILDDPLDQKSSESKVEQAEARRYFDMTVEPRLSPDGWLVAVMTRWAESDLGGYLKELAEKDDEWLVLEFPMLALERSEEKPPDLLNREPGEPLWPSRFSLEWCLNTRAQRGTAVWNAVWQLDPSGLGGSVFTSESWFRPIPPYMWQEADDGRSMFDRLRFYQAWDFAFSENKSASFSSGFTGGFDGARRLYLFGRYRRQVSQYALIEDMADEIIFWRPSLVGVEESAYRLKAVQDIIAGVKARLRARNVFTRIMIIKPTRNKVDRARLPAGRAEGGYLYVDHGAPWFSSFKTELLGFPRGEYTDQVDSVSLLAEMVWQPQLERDDQPRQKLVFNPHGSARLRQPLILRV